MRDQRTDFERIVENCARGNVYFTVEELPFVRRNALLSLEPHLLHTQPHAPLVKGEAIQRTVDLVAKLDNTFMFTRDANKVGEEKRILLNELLAAYGMPEIAQSADPVQLFVALKNAGLELVAKLTQQWEYEPRIRTAGGSPLERYAVVLKRVFGDVPMLLYGSALHSETPADIDVMVFPDAVDVKLYRRFADNIPSLRDGVPIAPQIVPAAYAIARELAEADQWLLREESCVINGSVLVPITGNEHCLQVAQQNVAMLYVRLRKAMTPEGQAHCITVPQRIRSNLKLPSVMHKKLLQLERVLDMTPDLRSLPRPDISRFTFTPENFAAEVVEANYMAYQIITSYLGRD